MLTMGFSFVAFIMLRYGPPQPTLLKVLSGMDVHYFQVLSPPPPTVRDDHVICIFDSVNVMCDTDQFPYVDSSLQSRDESHFVMVNLFKKLLKIQLPGI